MSKRRKEYFLSLDAIDFVFLVGIENATTRVKKRDQRH